MSQHTSDESYNPDGIRTQDRVHALEMGENILETDEDKLTPEVLSERLGCSVRKARSALSGLEKLRVYDEEDDVYRENGLSEDEAVRRVNELREYL